MELQTRIDALADKMATQLRVRGAGLSDVTAKAGRRLPRYLRNDADRLIEAEKLISHPKMARLVDERRLRKSEKRLNAFLDKQNPGAIRRAEFLDFLAKIAFVFVTIVLSVFFLLLWRGYFD